VRNKVPGAVPRAYADDISATVKASAKRRLKDQLTKVNDVTQKYEALSGAEVSAGKSYKFGDECVRGISTCIDTHLESCRLVGGPLTTAECSCPHTELEAKSIAK
jgi:hypothetical protein